MATGSGGRGRGRVGREKEGKTVGDGNLTAVMAFSGSGAWRFGAVFLVEVGGSWGTWCVPVLLTGSGEWQPGCVVDRFPGCQDARIF